MNQPIRFISIFVIGIVVLPALMLSENLSAASVSGLSSSIAAPSRSSDIASASLDRPAKKPAYYPSHNFVTEKENFLDQLQNLSEILHYYAGTKNALEEKLFDDAEDGRLDDFSLLEAALIAGGVEESDDLRRYDEKLDLHVRALAPSIRTQNTSEHDINVLFNYLHQKILRGGYHIESTDIREVFDRGRFNCVSASVVFNCLGKKLGLSCCGLETPGHTMCRFFLADHKLDVETTCPRWFEWMHDPEKQAELTKKILGTAPVKDIASLREIAPVQVTAMIYYNRGVDYLHAKKFAQAATVNAKSLLLDPTNNTVRGNLLATLNNWSIDLAAKHEFASAAALLRCGFRIDPNYAPFKQNFAHVYWKWSEELCNQEAFSEAAIRLDEALRILPNQENLDKARHRTFRLWATWFVGQNRQEEAEAVVHRASAEYGYDLSDVAACKLLETLQ